MWWCVRWSEHAGVMKCTIDCVNPWGDLILYNNWFWTIVIFNFRRSDKSVIFNCSQLASTCKSNHLTLQCLTLSSSPRVVRFVDQYLSIGTTLPSNYSIYGIGEHVLDTFKLRSANSLFTTYTYSLSIHQSYSVYFSAFLLLSLCPYAPPLQQSFDTDSVQFWQCHSCPP